jgi:hypothetical protein
MLRLAIFGLASWLIASAVPSNINGQEKGLLTGTVTRTDKTPIENARVKVVGTDIIAETRADGSYRLWGIPAGTHSLEVRMLGFATALMPFEISAGAAMEVPVTLVAIATSLDTVRVRSSDGLTPAMRGFEERRRRGGGKFFTMQEISRMQVRTVSDILRRAPGIQIQNVSGVFGPNDAVRSSRTGNRPCPLLFFVNGSPFPMQPDVTINNYISASDVAAMEVYSGASEVPPQFNSGLSTARCGVVVIWTRSGVDPSIRD